MSGALRRCTTPVVVVVLSVMAINGLILSDSFADDPTTKPEQRLTVVPSMEASPPSGEEPPVDQSVKFGAPAKAEEIDRAIEGKENVVVVTAVPTLEELIEQAIPALVVMFLPPTAPKTPPPPPPPPPDDPTPPGAGSPPPSGHAPEPASLLTGLVGLGLTGVYAVYRRRQSKRRQAARA